MRLVPAILLAAGVCLAAEPAKEKVPATLLTTPGKLLVSDDFREFPGKGWKANKGDWKVVDGVVRACEKPDDKHAAVIRQPLAFDSAVIAYSFKFEGTPRVTTLSLNGEKGHLCRVLVRPNGFTVQKDDQDGKNGPDRPAVLDTVETPIKAGEWHTLVVEVRGKEMVACLDGKHVAFGEHDALDKKKGNVGLTVGGEAVSFKDFRVWEAGANKDWEAAKAKLREARKKAPK